MEHALVKQLSVAAAIAWLASWFLPALAEVPGWMAFRYALSSLWPYQGSGSSGWEEDVPQVMSAMTNVVFFIMLVFVLAQRFVRPGIFIRIAIACFILNLYWFVQLLRDGSVGQLLIGYYAWLLAFALLIVIGVLIHRTSKTPTAGTPA